MKFSICIPNFNYGAYIGKTIQSVLEQSYQNFEILVSDNQSNDDSVAVVKAYSDDRVQLRINNNNVGFAGNLLKAAAMATGEYMIMLSSDDMMLPSALEHYHRLLSHFSPSQAQRMIVTSRVNVVNSQGEKVGEQGMDQKLWHQGSKDPELTALIGYDVYAIDGTTLLRQSLLMMRNPFPFLSTMYPKVLHDRVESYYHGHLINPDKPFAWELLRLADRAYFVDYPLFAYREHNQNQGSQQAKMGALKHQVDEYTATLNVSEQMLKQVNLDREDLIQAFIEQDIALRGLKMLSEGNSLLAKRTLLFGRATYPQFINRNFKIWGLRILLSLGFIGQLIAKASYRTAVNKWQQKQH